MEEKLNENNMPSDFDEKKSYFKTLANNAANKKYKTKVLRHPSYNYISINIFHDRDVLVVGIMLMTKVFGVNRVYECNDGFYMQVASLDNRSQFYGLELLSDRDGACCIGPNLIDKESITRDQDIYHVFLDNRYLQQQRIDHIVQANMIAVGNTERIQYGDRGDEFSQEFVQKSGGKFHTHN
jgi:hypothetical protein